MAFYFDIILKQQPTLVQFIRVNSHSINFNSLLLYQTPIVFYFSLLQSNLILNNSIFIQINFILIN